MARRDERCSTTSRHSASTPRATSGPLPPKTVELIGTWFFWIWHRHPVAILGFLALEAFHPHAPTVERLIEKTGLPRDGFRQLLLHAKLDVSTPRSCTAFSTRSRSGRRTKN